MSIEHKRPRMKGKQANQLAAARRAGIDVPEHLTKPSKENSEELRRLLREHEEKRNGDG